MKQKIKNCLLPKEYWENEFAQGWKNGHTPNCHLLGFLNGYEIGKQILDIGCGDGRHLVPMAIAGYQMTGLELTLSGIETTQKKLADHETSAKIIQGDFHQLPFEDESFDSAISIQTLHYNDWEGARKSFREITRVLKSGGFFFFRARSERGHWRETDEAISDKGITRREYRGVEKFVVIVHDYTLSELEELASENGLTILSAHDEDQKGLPGQWNVVFQRN
ncbi:MAG: class I SAM-dependent methyltransferase [Candidatus Falkowbacteria bacterium]|nr:class I SAM-dependent methyltransferase [Candidatus Falkowbacteria bacterium]